MRRSIWLLTLTLTLMTVASCGVEPPEAIAEKKSETSSVEAAPAPEPPSVGEAFDLIANSPEFGDFQFTHASISIPMTRKWGGSDQSEGGPIADPTALQMEYWSVMRELEAGRWIEFDGADNLVLTSQAEGDGRFLVRPNGFLDIVPLAKKEFVEVSHVGVSEGKVFADFAWRWIPNEIGGLLTSGRSHDRFKSDHYARASLLSTRRGWEVLLIEEVSPRDYEPDKGVDRQRASD